MALMIFLPNSTHENMINIKRVQIDSETDGQVIFFVEIEDGRVFQVIIHHYWHPTGVIRGDGKAELDHKGFKMTLTPSSSEVITSPQDASIFPEQGECERVFQTLIKHNLSEWDTYYVDRNPILS